MILAVPRLTCCNWSDIRPLFQFTHLLFGRVSEHKLKEHGNDCAHEADNIEWHAKVGNRQENDGRFAVKPRRQL